MAELRFESRHRQLEETALRVLTEQGISGVTLEAVADRLGYTKQSIYYYFKNKEALLLSCFKSLLEETKADIESMCASDNPPDAKLSEIIRYLVSLDSGKVALFAIHRDGAGIIASLNDESEREILAGLMRDIPKALVKPIKEGIQLGLFRKDKPESLARIVFGMVSGILMVSDGAKNADPIVEIILKGIQA
jgi:AcrR family transcriptional regulator